MGESLQGGRCQATALEPRCTTWMSICGMKSYSICTSVNRCGQQFTPKIEEKNHRPKIRVRQVTKLRRHSADPIFAQSGEWCLLQFCILCTSVWEKAMAPHSSTLAWQIPWMEEPGRLQSMGSLGVEHYWATSLSLFTFMQWRRKWQPTPVFLPGESQGRGAWWAAIYGVEQSRTRLKWLSSTSVSSLLSWSWPIISLLSTLPPYNKLGCGRDDGEKRTVVEDIKDRKQIRFDD